MDAAILGVGTTDFSDSSGRSELALAVEAIRAALADAGLPAAAVDGIVRYSYDSNAHGRLVRALGIRELSFFAEVPYGGTAAAGTVAQAAAAVDAGLAECVVCFRALNGRSGTRLGRAERHLDGGGPAVVARGDQVPGGAFAAPYGLLAPTQAMALWATRYQALHGVSDERLARALGAVAVTQRAYAQANPRAVTRGKELDFAGYLAGRMISTPLRLFDLCRETDGAAAVVVGRPALAGGRAVHVLAARQHLLPWSEPVPVFLPDITRHVSERSVHELYAAAGVTAADVDVAAIYDATTMGVLLGLEDFGFCGRGEGVDFLIGGGNGPGGALPVNTNGGLLSEAYIHGMNLVVDVVQQLRGEGFTQVAGAEVGLVASRGGTVVLGAASTGGRR